VDKATRELIFWVIAPPLFVGGSYALNLGIATLVRWVIA